jgi:hypothetical protein
LPSRYGLPQDDWVRVELVEADIEIGFRLIEMVEIWPDEAVRLVVEAEGVYERALARIARLQPGVRSNFGPLVGELRRAIDLARQPKRGVA